MDSKYDEDVWCNSATNLIISSSLSGERRRKKTKNAKMKKKRIRIIER